MLVAGLARVVEPPFRPIDEPMRRRTQIADPDLGSLEVGDDRDLAMEVSCGRVHAAQERPDAPRRTRAKS